MSQARICFSTRRPSPAVSPRSSLVRLGAGGVSKAAMGSLGIKATFLGSAFGSWDWGLDSSPGPLPSYKMNFKEHFGVLKILSKLRTFLVKCRQQKNEPASFASPPRGPRSLCFTFFVAYYTPTWFLVFFNFKNTSRLSNNKHHLHVYCLRVDGAQRIQ